MNVSSDSDCKIKCGCEPIHIDLMKLFPGTKHSYECSDFKGTRCQWHWTIPCKVGRASIGVSGKRKDGSIWLWVEANPAGMRAIRLSGIPYEDYLDDVVQVNTEHAGMLSRVLKPKK